MNAQKIWRGSDYAMGYKRKGALELPVNAQRVKILDIHKVQVYGKTKDRTLVKVMILGDDGMPTTDPPTIRDSIATRDILEHWDEYIETVEDEREAWKERQAKREQERREALRKRQEENAVYYIGQFLRQSMLKWERQEAERKRKEEEERKRARETRLRNVLIARGLDREGFWLVGEQVCIKFDELERWLGFGS